MEKQEIMNAHGLEKISVVIRSRSSSGEVLHLIKCLEKQTVRAEIIVVDSGSSAEVIESLRQMDGIVLVEISSESFTSAGALNAGCKRAHGSLIAILSQDAMPAQLTYLETLSSFFANEKLAGAYGRQIPCEHDHPLNIKDLTKTYPPQSRLQTQDCWFDNCCSMIRKDLWLEHAFDESALVSEDHEWAQWALANGHVIRYCAEAQVVHSHKRTISWLWNRFRAEGEGLGRIHGRSLPLWKMLFQMTREIVSDCLWLARRGRGMDLWRPFLDRPIKHMAYYIGYRKSGKTSAPPG